MTERSHAATCRSRGHDRLRTLLSEVREDARRFQQEASPYHPIQGRGDGFLSSLFMPAVQCVMIHRLAHYLHRLGLSMPARFLSGLNHLLYKIRIPVETCVLGGLHLPHPAGLVLECQAGRNLTLYAMSTVLSEATSGQSGEATTPILGDNVTIAGDGSIIGAVVVGNGCKVGLCTRINQSVPAYSTVVQRTYRLEAPRVR